jgi:hypothetical protein
MDQICRAVHGHLARRIAIRYLSHDAKRCSLLENVLYCNFISDGINANLGLRALTGGQNIAAVPDKDLAHAFLEAYSTLNTPGKNGFDSPSHSSLARDYAKSWLQQSLQLKLPEACQSSGPDLSQATAKFNASRTSIPKSLWPTIASSLSSSDFNSFCSLRDRIHNTFEGALEDIREYTQMPSDGASGLSQGSLSVPFSVPGSNFSQSALDTLATISSQIREHIQR